MPQKIEPCEFCDDRGRMHVVALDREAAVPCPFCSAGLRIFRELSRVANVPDTDATLKNIHSGATGMDLLVIGATVAMYPATIHFDGEARKNAVIYNCREDALIALLSALANEHIKRGRDVMYTTPGTADAHLDALMNAPILMVGEVNPDMFDLPLYPRLGPILSKRLRSKHMTVIGAALTEAETKDAFGRMIGAPIEQYAVLYDASDFSKNYRPR